jgi:hypothetical protein
VHPKLCRQTSCAAAHSTHTKHALRHLASGSSLTLPFASSPPGLIESCLPSAFALRFNLLRSRALIKLSLRSKLAAACLLSGGIAERPLPLLSPLPLLPARLRDRPAGASSAASMSASSTSSSVFMTSSKPLPPNPLPRPAEIQAADAEQGRRVALTASVLKPCTAVIHAANESVHNCSTAGCCRLPSYCPVSTACAATADQLQQLAMQCTT